MQRKMQTVVYEKKLYMRCTSYYFFALDGDVIAIDVENLQNMAQFLPLSQEIFSWMMSTSC